MKYAFFPALVGIGLSAMFAVAGCESSPSPAGGSVATGGDAGKTDTTVVDAKDAVADTVADIAADTTAIDTTTADVVIKVPCDGKCTAAEYCDKKQGENGTCVKQSCTFPDKWPGDIQKLSLISILDSKTGCDLNDDGQVDNKLSKVTAMSKDINTTLQDAVVKGSFVLLFQAPEWKTDGKEFDLTMLVGDVDPDPTNKDCDVVGAAANCKYTVKKDSYDKTSALAGFCPAQVAFSPAIVTDGKLAAGGDAQTFTINIDVSGIALSIPISKAQLSGTVTDANNWKSTKAGQICGVLTKEDLFAAIDAVPPEILAKLGDAATIKTLVGSLLTPDIDCDGDGKLDCISVALGFETVPGQITGMTPNKAP